MSPLLKIEKHKHPEKIVVYFEAKLNDIAYKGSISWRWWAIFIPAAKMVAGIRAEDEIIIENEAVFWTKEAGDLRLPPCSLIIAA